MSDRKIKLDLFGNFELVSTGSIFRLYEDGKPTNKFFSSAASMKEIRSYIVSCLLGK